MCCSKVLVSHVRGDVIFSPGTKNKIKGVVAHVTGSVPSVRVYRRLSKEISPINTVFPVKRGSRYSEKWIECTFVILRPEENGKFVTNQCNDGERYHIQQLDFGVPPMVKCRVGTQKSSRDLFLVYTLYLRRDWVLSWRLPPLPSSSLFVKLEPRRRRSLNLLGSSSEGKVLIVKERFFKGFSEVSVLACYRLLRRRPNGLVYVWRRGYPLPSPLSLFGHTYFFLFSTEKD